MGNHQNKNRNNNDKLYAEVIRVKGENYLKPIKVILNEQIASTAVDSIRESHDLVKALAKDLILDVLNDPNNPKKLGVFINHTLSFESVLYPTRDLIYWTLKLDSSHKNFLFQSKWQVNYWMKNNGCYSIVNLSECWLNSSDSKDTTIIPFLQSVLTDKNTVADPLAKIISTALPLAQVRFIISFLQ
jgi:hypothetical protein